MVVVRALFDFTASEDDELSFKKGAIITVTEQDDDGWWSGTIAGKDGQFPANYVAVINQVVDAKMVTNESICDEQTTIPAPQPKLEEPVAAVPTKPTDSKLRRKLSKLDQLKGVLRAAEDARAAAERDRIDAENAVRKERDARLKAEAAKAERLRREAEEADIANKKAAESNRLEQERLIRVAAEESAERAARLAAAQAENERAAAVESARLAAAEEEAERARLAAAQAEKERAAAIEAARLAAAEEEAERYRLAAAQAEKERAASVEAARLAAAEEKAEHDRLAAAQAEKEAAVEAARLAAEEKAEHAQTAQAEKDRVAAVEAAHLAAAEDEAVRARAEEKGLAAEQQKAMAEALAKIISERVAQEFQQRDAVLAQMRATMQGMRVALDQTRSKSAVGKRQAATLSSKNRIARSHSAAPGCRSPDLPRAAFGSGAAAVRAVSTRHRHRTDGRVRVGHVSGSGRSKSHVHRVVKSQRTPVRSSRLKQRQVRQDRLKEKHAPV